MWEGEGPLWAGEETGGLIEGKRAVLMTFSKSAAERDAFISPTTLSWSGRPTQRGWGEGQIARSPSTYSQRVATQPP